MWGQGLTVACGVSSASSAFHALTGRVGALFWMIQKLENHRLRAGADGIRRELVSHRWKNEQMTIWEMETG